LTWLLFLRDAKEIVQQLLLTQHFHPRSALDNSQTAIDLDEIGLPLRLRVLGDFGNPKRELPLLTALAVLHEHSHSAHDILVVSGHGSLRLLNLHALIAKLRTQLLLELGKVGAPRGGCGAAFRRRFSG
jgi:hypothetical protein